MEKIYIKRLQIELADVIISESELKTKYPSGIIITDSSFNPKVLKDKTMREQQILEVLVQNKPME